MTKDELEKEAEEYAEGMTKYYASTHEDCIPSQFEKYLRNAYISSAEPREKRIEELERKLKVETELSNRLGLAYREYEQLTKEQDEHLAELEKENAELKKLKRECETSLCRAEYQYNYEQLTKAKEIIKKFLLWENDWHDKTESKYELLKEAEQFIKDCEVEK